MSLKTFQPLQTSVENVSFVFENIILHGDYRSYMTGFELSVILTAIPFILAMSGGLESQGLTAMMVLLFAVVQIFVHMIYFLHMNVHAEGGWTVTALVFSQIVVVICLAGTN